MMIRANITRSFPAATDSAGFRLNVEFEAPAGVTVLFGPSGSGKTLTLDSLAGFAQPDSGRILLNDRILFDGLAGVNLAPQARKCGYVFQNYALFPHMTLRENLEFAATHFPRLERHRKIAEQLERFKLTTHAGRFPRELSGGQQQRGSIARALLAEPLMLLLDEPSRGMDAVLRADLHSLIQDLRQSLKIPMVLVTHDPDECLALADRILLYDGGSIIRRGTPKELLDSPGTVTAAGLLGGFNLYEAEAVAIDPGRQTSRVRLLDHEIAGPHLRGCFKGDVVALCIRPEELRATDRPGDNRIRRQLIRTAERPQFIRADFGAGVVVDIPRDQWSSLHQTAGQSGWWIEIPAGSLRQLTWPSAQ